MKYITLVILAIALIGGCTEIHEPPIHPSDWAEPDSEYSHVAKIIVSGIETCKSCHGSQDKNDYEGGTSGISCYQCHAGGPSGHPAYENWVGSSKKGEFHGYFIQGNGVASCKKCHSNQAGDFRGGTSGISCYQCHAGGPSGHPAYENWVGSSDSDEFHGKLIQGNGLATCKKCHSNQAGDFRGGTSGISCYQCHAGGPSGHPAYENWVGSSDSDEFHGKLIQGNGLATCKKCHSNQAGDFRGGTSGISCYQCHAGGPSGHPAYENWMGASDNDQFHGKMALAEGTNTCQPCHGQNLDGGIAQLSCLVCHSVISF